MIGNHVLDVCLRSGGGLLLGGGLVTSFVSPHGNKLEVSEGFVRGTLVGITGGETDVAGMFQGDMM